jgi:hypothetical protein
MLKFTTHQSTSSRAPRCAGVRARPVDPRLITHKQTYFPALPSYRARTAASSNNNTADVTPALLQANRQWLQHALDNKLVDAETGCTVVIVGACFFAPLQEQLVQAALQQVQPDYIALEQPADAASAAAQPGVLLSHPMWIQILLDYEEELQPALRRGLTAVGSMQPPQLQLQQLEQQLLDIGHPHAKVGRDIMDPWETLGFYGALDLARTPAVLVPALQQCGFLPGLELLAAVTHALETGTAALHCCHEHSAGQTLQRIAACCSCSAQVVRMLQHSCCCKSDAVYDVQKILPAAQLGILRRAAGYCALKLHVFCAGVMLSCIDASLKLQEGWVKQLLNSFTLDEQQVKAYQPAKDLTANEQLLPPAARAWDRQLAAAAQQLQAAVQSGAADASQASAEQQSLLLFKVSKATAAAMLAPAAAQEAMQRLQRLQPLKWAHFALRQRYMARQVKELCAAAAKAAGLQPSVAVRQQQQDQQHQTTAAGGSQASVAAAGKAPTVLVVVGRQHVQGLQAMWQDPSSPLWRDRMPRSFAASVVEREGSEDAAATDSASASAQAGSAAAAQPVEPAAA